MADQFRDAMDRPAILVSPRWVMRSAPGVPLDRPAPLEGAAADFFDAIIMAGGMPVLAPMTSDEGVLAPYVQRCAGLALAGGEDVNPRLWGDKYPYDPSLLCDKRDSLELALISAFIAADKPIFATCRGYQLLNVSCGGSLLMDIKKRSPRPGTVLWHHTGILHDAAHPVEVKPATLLSQCLQGMERIQTNSAHHCCVERLGEGLVLCAEATDGMPEAIEMPQAHFVLGVQWHPECTWRHIKSDELLWLSFVDACR